MEGAQELLDGALADADEDVVRAATRALLCAGNEGAHRVAMAILDHRISPRLEGSLLALLASSPQPTRGALDPLARCLSTAAPERIPALIRTLSRIARKHGISAEVIAEVNQIGDPNQIAVGQILRIPVE